MEGAGVTIFVTVQKIYYPLLCIMGIPGTIKHTQYQNTERYTIYIINDFIIYVINNFIDGNKSLLAHFVLSDNKQRQTTIYSYDQLSSWIVVVFTIERYLVLRSTAAKQHFSQAWVTKLTCMAIVLVSHLFSVPLGWINIVTPVNFTVDGENVTLPRCRYRDEAYSTVIVWITTFLSGGIPIVLVIIFNYLIGYHLCRASNLFTKEERRVMRGKSTRGMLRRTILLLGTVSVAFVVLSLPRFVTYCILRTEYNNEHFNRNDYSIPINVAGDLANMLQNLNSTTNFLLYCMVSRRFRRELVQVVTCKAKVLCLQCFVYPWLNL
uniref:G-protein coupled receptors family 1 profile domain-containing protein n=1 Tax=Lates calcarifer TaxID=8187 RepID=A0A4W6BZY6_LATCA